MHNSLTEDDLVKIFSMKERSKKRVFIFFDIIYKLLIFVFIVCICYIVINFRAYAQKLNFWYKKDFQSQVADKDMPNAPSASNLENSADAFGLPVMNDNHIDIPIIDVNAPINFRINNTPKEVSIGLESGVIQLNGTALPGEKGNVYITGHSSNYIWAKGDYNSIFALLDKLVIGDKIYIKFGNVIYCYNVFDKKIVLKTDLSVTKSTNDSRLTLVTCWPVGTSLKRLVVLANQEYPDPENNKEASANTGTFETLTSGR